MNQAALGRAESRGAFCDLSLGEAFVFPHGIRRVKIAESILYCLAKQLYTRNPGQSEEMTEALADFESYATYRQQCADKVMAAADEYGVPVTGRRVLDLGCYDGALSVGYLKAGADSVVGVDIDVDAVRTAQERYASDNVTFHPSETSHIPLPDESVDTILCYDVFEHVARPQEMLSESYRVLRPGGKMLIGTWGWYHPFAPHLWSTMPVPWAHVVFSERTMLRVCRRVYHSDWYVHNMHDFDENGNRKEDKYTEESISTDYLNKLLIRDFEKVFRESSFAAQVHQQRFSSKWAAWTAPLLKVPFVREFFTAYLWIVLDKPAAETNHVPAAAPPEAAVLEPV